MPRDENSSNRSAVSKEVVILSVSEGSPRDFSVDALLRNDNVLPNPERLQVLLLTKLLPHEILI
jgi:hypothetical protein